MPQEASDFLSKFTRVYTTNYDLLLYWTIIYKKERFRDYFWGRNLMFDLADVGVRENKTRVFYLHGAAFEGVKKIRAQRADLLAQIYRNLRKGKVPVFVSEGRTRRPLGS
jgi:hypothetical protein